MDLKPYPLLDLGTSTRPTFFPAELISIEPGQSTKAKLNGNETTNMLDHACKPPSVNATSIEAVARRVLDLDGDFTGQFGLSVGKQLLAVNARVLRAPSIKYGGKSGDITPRDGSWNMRDVKVHKGSHIKRWTWFQVGDSRSPDLEEEYIQKFRDTAGSMGVKLEPPEKSPGDHCLVLPRMQEVLDKIFQWAVGQELEFLLFIFRPHEDKSGLYNSIKTLGDCTYGIHTSCMVYSKFTKGNPAPYFANCALKWNLKAGGVNHKLSRDIPILEPKQRTMVMGYDVTHPTNMPLGKSDDIPSLVGLVSSVDSDLGQWPSSVWEQSSKQEMLDDGLAKAFIHHLKLWQAKNKATPSNIVVFRDGVSEGQFTQVLDQELPYLQKACQAVCGKNVPKLSIIVSVKRHQTRFYPSQDGKEDPKNGNIRCGTVVDREVTQARFWDFFLTAHTALKGTARPAHYTVLMDEIFRPKHKADAANQLEKLTHEMCYLFGRATKAISICPPAYYADIVCERARVHRPDYADDTSVSSGESSPAREIHENLRNSMYYI